MKAKNSLLPHLYADDTLIDGSCRPENPDKLSECVSLHRWGCSADEFHSLSVKYRQDRGDLVCYESPSDPAANFRFESRWWRHPTCRISLRSGFLHRLRPHDDISRDQSPRQCRVDSPRSCGGEQQRSSISSWQLLCRPIPTVCLHGGTAPA